MVPHRTELGKKGQVMAGGNGDAEEVGGRGGTVQQRNNAHISAMNNPASDGTLDLEDFDNAIAFIEKNTKRRIINIHPTMLGVIGPLSLNDKDEVQLNMPDCNHNTPDPAKVCHIMNNMCNNVMKTKNTHSRDMGADAEFLAIHWKKVSVDLRKYLVLL